LIANKLLGNLIASNAASDQLAENLPRCHALLEDFLHRQPFNIRALNLLFVTEVLEARLENPNWDRATFEIFKQKAQAIRELGRDANTPARASLLFLYSLPGIELTEAEEKEREDLHNRVYNKWRTELRHHVREGHVPKPKNLRKRRPSD
jgi:hypothetical protein